MLDASLDRLLTAGLLFRQGTGYLFNHALVQDAAYASLLRDQRRAIHGRIAASLEAHSAIWWSPSPSCWRATARKRA